MAVLGVSGQVSGSQTVAVRPLSVGMITEGSSMLAPAGSMLDASGLDAVESGLRRIGGFIPLYTEKVPFLFGADQTGSGRNLGEIPQDFFTLVLENGDTRAIAITNRLLYSIESSTGAKPIYWHGNYTVAAYSVDGGNASVSVDGDEVTLRLLQAGDWVTFDDGVTLYRVSGATYDNVSVTTALVLEGAPAGTPTTFKILKPFKVGATEFIDYCLARHGAWLVDGSTPTVFRYDGSWLEPITVQESTSDATRTMFGAKRIAFYRDRLYFGDVQDGSTGSLLAHQRVRWTEVLGWGLTVSYAASSAVNYQDLVTGYGEVDRIVGLEDLIFVFMTDLIYYGQQTSLEGLPYAFLPVQTGGIAAVGPKAIVGYLGGIVFVGQDDLYLISLNQGYPTLQKTQAMIAESILPPKYSRSLVVKLDPNSSRIVVGVSTISSDYLSELWFWNYRTKGWTRERDINIRALATTAFVDQLRYEDLGTETYETSPYAADTYGSLMAIPGAQDFFMFDTLGYLYKYSRTASSHILITGGVQTATPVAVEIETQDYDFDAPDGVKTWLGLGLRLREGAAMQLAVQGSTDSGKTWKPLGTLILSEADCEDQIAFRLTGSTARFKMTGSTTGDPFTIVELTMKLKVRGSEQQRGTLRTVGE